ncbi:MAG: hypothetical protein AB7K64_14430 [Variibacter sp.]
MFRIAAALMVMTALMSGAARAEPTTLITHESYIGDLHRTADFDVEDVKATFGFVLKSLPDRVQVFPTENYYYFRFYDRGVEYMGNIRLENGTRDEGKVYFAYQIVTTAWRDPDKDKLYHALLSAQDGVTVEKVEPLLYRVTFEGKSVLFALNDLSNVKPPEGMLALGERYLGPVFDDSGIRFFLVYSSRIKAFHYILDETETVPEKFFASSMSDRIVVGYRTGFAFYRDEKRERKILVGVYEGNVSVNNYFDGPFDQLPDNFLDGEELRNALIAINPKLKGTIDRFGSRPGGETRYLIEPYLEYRRVEDLEPMVRCAKRNRRDDARYYRCFVVDEWENERAASGETRGSPRR